MKIAISSTLVALVLMSACAKKDDTTQPNNPQNVQQGGAYPQQGGAYPQQGGAYPQQGGAYPQQGGAYPQQGGAYPQQGGATAPTGGQMATPNQVALPCQNDSSCGLAHCNTQYGKCAFPCQSQVDCIQGATCNTVTGFCLPGGAPQTK